MLKHKTVCYTSNHSEPSLACRMNGTLLHRLHGKHYVDISTTFQEAEDALFRTTLSNRSHVLYTHLSERPEIAYSLRTRNHNKFLIPKTSDLADRHFIIRSLYKNLYLKRSYKSNLYVDTFVTIAFYCMYMCKKLCTHSCVLWLLVSLLLLTICRHSILLYLYVHELCTQMRLTTVFKE